MGDPEVPAPPRLVRTVTASIAGRPCGTCRHVLLDGEQVIQLRCRCTYHEGCIEENQECCLVCSAPDDATASSVSSIHIITDDGRTLIFGVKPSDTILSVKQLIAEEDLIPVQQMRILYRGVDVVDAEPLRNFIGSSDPLEFRLHEPT